MIVGVVSEATEPDSPTVVYLAKAAHRRGLRTLLVDLDPRAKTTNVLLGGVPTDRPTMADVLSTRSRSEVKASDVVSAVGWVGRGPRRFALDSVRVLPSGGDALAPVGLELMAMFAGREYEMRRVLESFDDDDLILVDCPPLPEVLACNELSMLTINGLVAAHCALVVATEFPHTPSRIPQLLEMIEDIQEYNNPSLTVAGMMVRESTGEFEFWPKWLATKQSPNSLADLFQQDVRVGQPHTLNPSDQPYDDYLTRLLDNHP